MQNENKNKMQQHEETPICLDPYQVYDLARQLRSTAEDLISNAVELGVKLARKKKNLGTR